MLVRTLPILTLAAMLSFTGSTALADDCGNCPEEEYDSGEEDEEDEDEKGCSHIMMPQNLAVMGVGLLLFVVGTRRGSPQD